MMVWGTDHWPCRRSGLVLFLVILGSIIASGLAAQDEIPDSEEKPGEVKIELDREQITVGDRVQAVVRLVWEGEAPSEEPRFPAWQDTWGQAEVLAVGEISKTVDQSGRRIYEQPLTLTAFATGEIELPPLVIAVPVGERTLEMPLPSDVGFEVQSILPEVQEGEALEPRDPAAMQQARSNQLFWLLVAIFAVLCALAVWRLRRRLSEAHIHEILRPATPRQEPLPELLDRLGKLSPNLGNEPVHTGLSLALRDYLGRRLEFPALESTTSEIQRHLRKSVVPIEIYQKALKLLRDCDQVKFARIDVDAANIRERLAAASELGQKIELTVRPPEPSEEEAA